MQRKLNFELLRIISMVLIIFHHALLYLSDTVVSKVPSILLNLLSSGGKYGVILFVLITGYFECEKKYNFKKIYNIILHTLFYSYLFLTIGILVNDTVNLKDLIRSIFPILFNQYWFVTAYVILYLLIPFLNKLINIMDKKEYLNLIIILSLFICILPSFTLTNFSISNLGILIYIYLLGGFIKIYFENVFINNNKCLILSILIYIVGFILHVFAKEYISLYSSTFISLNSVFFYCSAILLFIYFTRISISERFRKIILFFSSTTFGVYLLHENIFARKLIWNNILVFVYDKLNINFIIFILLYIIGVYIVCSIIDKLYLIFIDKKIGNLFEFTYKLVGKFIIKLKKKRKC